MGIDMTLEVEILQALSSEDFTQLTEDFKRVFQVRGDTYPSLRINTHYHDYECSKVKKGHTLVEIIVVHRCYGVYYERGYPLDAMLYADYFEWRYPGCVVYYGGDGNVSEWPKEKREALKHYYFKHDTRPYHDKSYIVPEEDRKDL